MKTAEIEECRKLIKPLECAFETYADCEVDDITVSRLSAFDDDYDFDEDGDGEEQRTIATDDSDASEDFTFAVETIVDAAKWVPKLVTAVEGAHLMHRRLQGEIEAKGLAVDEWQAMKKLLRQMVAYREQAGPLGFQLEKFDDYLRQADVILNQDAATL